MKVNKINNLNKKIIIFGNGFSGSCLAANAIKFSSQIFVVSRTPNKNTKDISYLDFNDFEKVSKHLDDAIIISTAPPENNYQDPILSKYGTCFKTINSSFGYISSTSVYGEGTLYENSITKPNSLRGKNRLLIEREWVNHVKNVKIFRSGGIYGKDRHPMIKFLNGKLEVVTKSAHYANRIHVEDLSKIILLSFANNIPSKLINVTDQNNVSALDAIEFVTKELNLSQPKPIHYKDANISEMAKSFFETSRVIRSNVIKKEIAYDYLYPDYKLALLELTKELLDHRKDIKN